MTGVVTLFGETDLQPALRRAFSQKELWFVCENANTSVQLIGYCEEYADKIDAVIISANAVNPAALVELISEIKGIDSGFRIVLILNGSREQYLRSQLKEFISQKVDILFDNHGFDARVLIAFLQKGRLKDREMRSFDEPQTITPEEIINGKDDRKEQQRKIEDEQEDILEDDSDDWETIDDLPESFSSPKGHYSIAVLGACHGCGVTTMVINLAEYFAIHNFNVAVVDFSGSNALGFADIPEVDYITEITSIKQLKKQYNLIVFDFGTPYNIAPDGSNFMLEQGYPVMNLAEVNSCDLKLIMGFSDSWNIGKIKFFLDNNQWREMINASYIFITADKSQNLKKYYRDNIFERSDDLCSVIYDVIMKEELK